MGFERVSSRTAVLFVFVAALYAPTGQAANWLTEVLQYQVDDDLHEIEIVLGESLSLTETFRAQSQKVFTARATATDNAPHEGWQYIEMSFDEGDNELKRVAVEGSVNKGFKVTIEFHRPVYLQTLPQYSPNRFSVLHSSVRKQRSLNRFSDSANANFGPVAIRFTLSGRFAIDAIPFEIASNRRTYRPPGKPDELRVGFFPTGTAANVALRRLRGAYPDATLVHVSAAEVEYAKHFNLFTDRIVRRYDNTGVDSLAKVNTPAPRLSVRSVTPATIDLPPEPEPAPIEWSEDLDRGVLDQAREAYLDRDFDRAIALYTKATNEPRLQEEALEMLGVTHEKNRQLAHAKRDYEQFLQAYPQSASADRVQQRLQSLVGNEAGIAELHDARRATSPTWHTVGSLSQFYRRQSIEIEQQDRTIPIDAVFSDLTVITRRQSANATHEARASIGHVQDFSNRDNSRTFRVHRLYWDGFFDKYDFGVRVGRQSRNNAGVLGRYDGITATYRQSDKLRWNMIGGYLANSSYDSISTTRPIYGFNAELELFDGRVEIAPFFVQQERDGVLDRRAVGMHGFYFTDQSRFSGLVDYDIHHQALNNLHLTGSYDLGEAWRVHGAYDLRRSPYLITSNALIGQSYDDLSEFEQSLIDLTLDDIAEDRTAVSNLLRFGVDGSINDAWSLSLDASISEISETDASLGINALEDRSDFYLTAQLRANDLLADNSYSAVQLRYVESDFSKTTMAYLINRFSWHDWLIHAKLIVAQRTFGTNEQEQRQLRPSLRLDYRGFKRFRLEFEVGYDWTSRETVQQDIEMTGLYFHVGYRTLF